jgi:hypothetical protein
MNKFVARENAKHLGHELEIRVEPKRRATMLTLLVEEANHLGFIHQQLGRLDARGF